MNDKQTAEDWRRIKEIFSSAMEKDEAERNAFVESVCDGNNNLRDEVLLMLKLQTEAENFIETPAFSFNEALKKQYANFTDKTFGNYKIIREIGRGGMGAVFLAERNDGAFQQQVAIKIIRQTLTDTAVEKQFKRERQILASLNHPYIARLLDGGVSDAGEPFLAMEYIEGASLLRFVEENELDVNECLRLFLKVCSAVAFAHRNLIIHRDIKPSNIFVTKEGEPKLLDFGLAKVFSENFAADVTQTATAFRALTPAYASPEQIRGLNVTTASDIYSLGVVLYELLTGERPHNFANKTYEEMLSTISQTEPVKPSVVAESKDESSKFKIQNSKLLKGDLDNIVLTALRKEPEHRYKTVDEFANDIERHLNGLPVMARPQTFGYRASKFIQRNKITVGAIAMVFLAVITGLAASLWQANQARKERDIAQARFNDVRQLSNTLLFEITPKIERLQGSTEAREILVKRALEYLDKLAKISADDSVLQGELAAAYEKIGELQGNPGKPNLGDFAGALESFTKANVIRQNLPDTRENKKLLAENFRYISDIRFEQSDTKGSFQAIETALKIYQELLNQNAESNDLRISHIKTQIDLAQLYQFTNQFNKAVEVSKRALTDADRLNKEDKETQEILTTSRSDLSYALSWNGQQAEAETEMTKAVTLAESLAVKYPNDAKIQQTVWRTFMQASSIYESIKDDASLQYAQRALQSAIKAVASDTADIQAKHNLMRSYYRIGTAFVNLKKLPQATSNLETAEKLLHELIEREPKNRVYQIELGRLYTTFGDAKLQENNLTSALKAFQDSAGIREKVLQADENNTNAQRDLAVALKSIGEIYLRLSYKEKAKQNYLRALEILMYLKEIKSLGSFDDKLIVELQNRLSEIEDRVKISRL